LVSISLLQTVFILVVVVLEYPTVRSPWAATEVAQRVIVQMPLVFLAHHTQVAAAVLVGPLLAVVTTLVVTVVPG
jgi:hypothetical protein